MNTIQLLQQHLQQSLHVQEVRWDGTREGYIAAVMPSMKTAPVIAGHARLTLPNGMAIVHANHREAFVQYHEFFSPTSPVLRHGITLGAGDVVVDIGANIGMFTLMAQLSGAHIYAVEPAPSTCDLLRLNTLLYAQQGQVTVIQAGIGAQDGQAVLSYNRWSPARSGFYRETHDSRQLAAVGMDRITKLSPSSAVERDLLEGYAEEMSRTTAVFQQIDVPMLSLESLLQHHQIGHVDLLKLDVEGMELEILSALPEERWGAIQQALVEVHVRSHLEPCQELLQSHGFITVVEPIDEFGDGVYQIYARRAAHRAVPQAASATTSPQEPPILTVHALEQIARPFQLPVVFRILDPYEPKMTQERNAAAFLQSIRPKLEMIFCDMLGPGKTRDDFMTHATSPNDLFDLASRVYQEFGIRLPLSFLMSGPYTVDALEQVLKDLATARP